MSKAPSNLTTIVNQQGAGVLLAVTFDFLRRNGVDASWIAEFAQQQCNRHSARPLVSKFRTVLQAYEDMGMVMSTWYANPQFLDSSGRPLPLSVGAGPRSVASLVKKSRVKITTPVALAMMRDSLSTKMDANGNMIATKRIFILPRFEIPRATLVIERFLDTLRRNSLPKSAETRLLLERSCYVTAVDLKNVAPILRDIKGRGTSFMDCIDGEIEAYRSKSKPKHKSTGELGVLVFAWTRHRNSRRSAKHYSKNK